jgi:hypothetical protein
MIRAVAIATGLALLLSGPASAQAPSPQPPEGFTWYVLNQLNEFYFDIEDPANRPPVIHQVPDGVLVPVDVSKDGKADWLIAWPMETQFCGTGGCQRSLYVSTENGYVRALDRQAFEVTIADDGGEVRVAAWVHHLNCLEVQEQCRVAWAWDPALERLVERPVGHGATLLSDVGAQAVEREAGELPSNAPAALSELWHGSRVTCQSHNTDDGFEVRRAEITDIPDVNGDGVRDWLVVPPGACQPHALEPAFAIWASTGEGEVARVYEAPHERFFSLDIGPTPAVVRVSAPCEHGTACPSVALRWDAELGRLIEAR